MFENLKMQRCGLSLVTGAAMFTQRALCLKTPALDKLTTGLPETCLLKSVFRYISCILQVVFGRTYKNNSEGYLCCIVSGSTWCGHCSIFVVEIAGWTKMYFL